MADGERTIALGDVDGVTHVTFALSRGGRRHVETERMWAQQVGPDLFVIRNTPFFVDGVSFLDTVRAERVDGEWVFRKLHACAGHSTYRIRRLARSIAEPWKVALAPVLGLGCHLESAGERLAVLDVPPAADIHAVLACLERGEDEGRWEFHEGHYGRPRA